MYCYLAHIILECTTPLAIGSGKEIMYTDSPVMRDFNGLPYIPWTSIKGALRAVATASELASVDAYFGSKKADNPMGANYIGSDAFLVGEDQKVCTTLEPNLLEYSFYTNFKLLPIRQHVAIDAFGTSSDKALFSNSIVYAGSRFKLEVKLDITEKNRAEEWKQLLDFFYHPHFRLGSQVTNGLGKTKVIDLQQRSFNLTNADDFDAFTQHKPTLDTIVASTSYSVSANNSIEAEPNTDENFSFNFTTDAIHIGAGYGDDKTDHANLREDRILWDDTHTNSKLEPCFVIPGSSIKGVLRHRVFYYLCPPLNYKDKEPVTDYCDRQKDTHQEVALLFGDAGDQKESVGVGNVFIKDVYIPEVEVEETLFMHNVIDRFTQGTVNNLLFSEQVYAIKKARLEIYVNKYSDLAQPTKEAWHKALNDLKEGRLPIGGNTTNGNGFLKSI